MLKLLQEGGSKVFMNRENVSDSLKTIRNVSEKTSSTKMNISSLLY